MGLKDWLARNVSGPQGYGSAMGPHAREAGSALANAVFLSHGKRPGGGQATIFDTRDEMEAAGFQVRFATRAEMEAEEFQVRYEELPRLDIRSLTEEEQQLFKCLTVAIISYAFIVTSNAAFQNMRRDNTSKFRKGLGPSLLQSTVDCGLFDNTNAAQAALLFYVRLFESSSISRILNKEKPASGDLLEYYIIKSAELSGAKARFGVVRTGITGFDVVAVTLVEEFVKSIIGAARHYRW